MQGDNSIRLAKYYDIDPRTPYKNLIYNELTRMGRMFGRKYPPLSWMYDQFNKLTKADIICNLDGTSLTIEGLKQYGALIQIADGFEKFVSSMKQQYNAKIHVVSQSFTPLLEGSKVTDYIDTIYANDVYYFDNRWYFDRLLDASRKPIIIKEHMKQLNGERHVICIGDGETDLDMFDYVRDHGGYAILVYQGTQTPSTHLTSRANITLPLDYTKITYHIENIMLQEQVD